MSCISPLQPPKLAHVTDKATAQFLCWVGRRKKEKATVRKGTGLIPLPTEREGLTGPEKGSRCSTYIGGPMFGICVSIRPSPRKAHAALRTPLRSSITNHEISFQNSHLLSSAMIETR